MDDVHSANPKYKQIVYKQSRKWDYLLSDNPFSTEKFQSCFMYEKDKILELGYPANDPLYDKNLDKKADELKTKLVYYPIMHSKKNYIFITYFFF